MGNQIPVKTFLVPADTADPNQVPVLMALFDADGEPVSIPDAMTPAAAQADSTATDIAGIKTDFNALLAKLRTAGFLAT